MYLVPLRTRFASILSMLACFKNSKTSISYPVRTHSKLPPAYKILIVVLLKSDNFIYKSTTYT